jgi:hypothetical protein
MRPSSHNPGDGGERAVAFLADAPRARAAGREFRRDASRFEAEGVGGALSRPRFLLVKRARRPSAQMSKINNLRVRRAVRREGNENHTIRLH